MIDVRRPLTTFFRLVALGGWGLLAGCGGAGPVEPPTPSATVYAAYVLFAPPAAGQTSPQAVARVIVEGQNAACPDLTGGASNITTQARNNPHGFSVTVCEAAVPLNQALTVEGGGFALPAASLDFDSLVIFGDTGCSSSDCAAGPAPNLQANASAAAALQPTPGVVLHVGDYNYRGTGYYQYEGEPCSSENPCPVYDAGDTDSSSVNCQLDTTYISQNAGYSDRPDKWEDWRDDFFTPAKDLFAAAPFVFARGNHELCSRGGPGWFYFLDPSGPATGTTQRACPPQGDAPPPSSADGHIVFLPPYALEFQYLRVAVIDSANACDDRAPESTVAEYKSQLAAILPASGKTTWSLSHRPFWGFEETDPQETINLSLQEGLEAAFDTAPAGWQLAVAGHMHRFQSVTFTSGTQNWPPQLVVGDSGNPLDSTSADDPSGAFTGTLDGASVNGLELFDHVFAHVTGLSTGSWKASVIDAVSGPPTTEACCQSADSASSICAEGSCQ